MPSLDSPMPVLLAAALILGAAPLAAQAGPPDQEPGRPVTFHSPLDEVTLGGELRLRTEVRDPSIPVTGSGSANANTLRGRLQVGWRLDEYLDGAFEFQGNVAGTGSTDSSVVHQAWIQMHRIFGDYTVSAGRFELDFGEGRMVSPHDWVLANNTFDGALVDGAWESIRFNVWWTQAVNGQGATNPNTDFWGAYTVWDLGPALSLDAYALRLRDPVAGRKESNYGARLYGRSFDALEWDGEFVFQNGDRGANDVRAQAYTLELAYALDGGHNVGFSWSQATGDNTPGDTTDETFQAPFRDNHRFNGLADIVLFRNLNDIALRYWLVWNDRWTVHADLRNLSLQTTQDRLYAGPGAVGVATTGDDSIGNELDLYLVGRLSESLELTVGGALFMAGSGIANNDDQLWLFGQLEVFF